MNGETAVFDLGDGRHLVVKNWPSAALDPELRWEASVKDVESGRYGVPLPVVRVEEGT